MWTSAIYALNENQVYIGGDFTKAGSNQYTQKIAMWDGTRYTALGTGLSNTVHTIYALNENQVYIGGGFDNAGSNNNADNIAMWNKLSYIALGPSHLYLTSKVEAIHALDEKHVYIGGDFENAGSNNNADSIAMWNGTSYTALGTGLNDAVYAIYALDENHVYIGGDFTTAGGITVNKIAMWNGF